MTPTETQLIKLFLDWLHLKKIAAWRNNTGAMLVGEKRFVRFGTPGVPDIVGYLPGGKFLGIEAKTKTGRLSPAQKEFIEKATRAGCCVFVARSLEDMEREISETS